MLATERLKLEKSDLIKKYANRNNGFAFYQILSTITPYFALFYLAVISLSISYWLTALSLTGLILFTMRVFMMMHDAGHGCLFVTSRQNSIAGFIMGVMCGVPEYVWSKHHAYHHATNGNWNKYRGPLAILSSEEYSQLSKKKQLHYENSRNILLAPFGGFLYFIFTPRFTWVKGTIQLTYHIIKNKLKFPKDSFSDVADRFETRFWADWKEYRHMAANNIVLISIIVTASGYFGFVEFFIIYLIALSLAGALGIILFTVQHNFENSYATGDEGWDYHSAAIEGTSYLDLPKILDWFTADIGYHHVHHLSARIPNYKLRACHEEYQYLFKEVPTLKLKDVLSAFKFVLWDEASSGLISIKQYNELKNQQMLAKQSV
ncbi:MAG: fatty acid desaturase [Kangiella sp.]|nr:MAG: fatty acid desaturase [Kangiella sp.]